jgi:hypothetical protein
MRIANAHLKHGEARKSVRIKDASQLALVRNLARCLTLLGSMDELPFKGRPVKGAVALLSLDDIRDYLAANLS